VGNMQIPKKVD